MILKNYEIINYINKINNTFSMDETAYPISFIFYLKKNIANLLQYAEEIEKCRQQIGEKYGIYDESTSSFIIEEDKKIEAQQELQELMNIEQDVSLLKIKIKDFEDRISLSYAQMDTIMFMLTDE